MEKPLVIAAAVLMMLGFSMLGFAQNREDVGTPGAGYSTEEGTNNWLSSYTGEIALIDQNSHRLVVKGDEGERVFDVSRATMTGVPETHQFVTVKYTNENEKRVASSVTTVPQRVVSHMKWNYEKYVS